MEKAIKKMITHSNISMRRLARASFLRSLINSFKDKLIFLKEQE
jgi:hypothetical protein